LERAEFCREIVLTDLLESTPKFVGQYTIAC
jgi:hypothetical protein